MATEFNTRIKHKRDTSANWTSADPVLLNGEIIIVDTAGGSVRTKTGDGVKKYSQLPFDDEEIYSAISEKAVATETIAATLTAAGWVDMVQTVSNWAERHCRPLPFRDGRADLRGKKCGSGCLDAGGGLCHRKIRGFRAFC